MTHKLTAKKNLWHTKKYIFHQSDQKNRCDFDSFTLDSYCSAGCCHFFIWQSKRKEVSAPDWMVRYRVFCKFSQPTSWKSLPLAIKRNGLLIFTTTWINLQSMTLEQEGTRTQIHVLRFFLDKPWNKVNWPTVTAGSVLAPDRELRVIFNGHTGRLWVIEMFYIFPGMMIMWVYLFVKTHLTVYLKLVRFIFCIIIHQTT